MPQLPATDNPERGLISIYAPASQRSAFAALLALDATLAQLLRTTTEPALGQMRLAWWRESLEKLDHSPAPAEPVLNAIATTLLPAGITGKSLVPIVHGWEVLVEEEHLDQAALHRFGEGRGALFTRAGALFGAQATDPLAAAGQGWALADLSRHLSAGEEAGLARDMADPLLAQAAAARWSSNTRALGAMVLLARMDIASPVGAVPPVGSPRRVARLLWHRWTGR